MIRVGALVALLTALAAGSTATAASAYRNPTAGAAVALQIPGMHRAQVRRNVVYRRVAGTALRLDVYRPRGARLSRRLPVVFIGGPPGFGRTSGQKMGWAQLVAASGLAVVAFDHRSDGFLRTPRAPSSDVTAAIAYVRARAARLGVDGHRVCTLGFSLGTAPWHLWATMRTPAPFVRCNATYYGALDLGKLEEFGVSPAVAEEYSAITYLRRHGARIPPMLVAKAGREGLAGLNESIDEFDAEARRVGADVRVVTHETGPHGFDTGRSARARTIMRETLAFFRARLLPATRSLAAARPKPRPLIENCVTRAERRRVVRFRALDRVQLVGVELGRGPRAVILAHQGGGGDGQFLCAWLPYGRALVAQGYRVLVFDHRGFGSSGQASSYSRRRRVDFDVLAAIGFLRARGATSIVLGGASLGGSAVLAAAVHAKPAVNGVISFAAPLTFGAINGLSAARALKVPVLFLSATEDEPFPDEARRMYEACSSADKRLEIVPGNRHGAPVLRDPATRELVDGWIRAHMP